MAGRNPAKRELPSDVRAPAVAGMFYPADAQECTALAMQYVREAPLAGERQASHGQGPLVGGIVPHAGWICSGAIAGETIAALARNSVVSIPMGQTMARTERPS